MVQVSLTRKNRETLLRIIPNRADDTGMTFSFRKKKKEKQCKKGFQAEIIKRPSSRAKYYCFSNVYFFIPDSLEFKNFPPLLVDNTF